MPVAWSYRDTLRSCAAWLLLGCTAQQDDGAIAEPMTETGPCLSGGCEQGLVCSLDWCVAPYDAAPIGTGGNDDGNDDSALGDDGDGDTAPPPVPDLPPPTLACGEACTADEQCGTGRVCFDADGTGSLACAPSDCAELCDAGDCTYDPLTCFIDYCGEPSATCGQPCADDTGCEPGESCYNTGSGMLCLANECAECFAGELLCNYFTMSCVVISCEPNG